MNKYIIEGGIDFYEELYKSLDIEDINEKTDQDNNLCLITNQPLVENFVSMNCGHKFNYVALFLDLKNHKQKFNGMEGSSSKLSIDEIRCPYCRTKQQGVLPYYEEFGFPKINGVNDINPLTIQNKNLYSYKTCEYILENILYDPSGNNPVEFDSNNSGNCKFIKCFHTGTKINTAYSENYGDEKHYCWYHKKVMIKKYKKEIKDKQKLDVKKAKEEEKQKAKEEKQKAKEEIKKTKEEIKKAKKEYNEKAKKENEELKKMYKKKPNNEPENVVIGETNIIECGIITGCIEILKFGQNKGKPCGCKIMLDDLCNRHLKIKNEITLNNI